MTVTKYHVNLKGAGVAVTPLGDAIGKSLPFRLEQGEAETWAIDIDSVRALVHAGQTLKSGAREVYMTIDLATGKTKKTRSVKM